jgi:FkbM family methyltransferase
MVLKNLIRDIIVYINSRKARHYQDLLKNILNGQHITLIDIGAADDIEPRWKKISSFLSYVGFEPDQRSFELLEKTNHLFAKRQIISSAIWGEKGELTFNLCKNPQNSSVFTPNESFVKLFPESERFAIESKIQLTTTTLAQLELNSADFIKLDIQGGALLALNGAKNLLRKCLGLEIEVEFTPIYEKQPLYGDVVSFLEQEGFVFIDFVNLCRWERHQYSGYGQCVFGDGLFLRSPENILAVKELNANLISKYISICALYNRYDLIDKTSELIKNTKFSTEITNIASNTASLRRIDRRARRISNIASKLLTLLGHEYRSHLIQ